MRVLLNTALFGLLLLPMTLALNESSFVLTKLNIMENSTLFTLWKK